MIVAMKKLSVLLFHRQKEEFLSALGDLGVVHVVEREGELTGEAMVLSERIRRAERVVRALAKAAGESSAKQAPCDNPSGVIEQFEQLEAKRETTIQEITALGKDIAALAPWGDFSPLSLERLAGAGIKLRFFEMTGKNFSQFDTKDYTIQIISRDDSRVRFVLVERGNVRTQVDAEELVLPRISLADARSEVENRERLIADIKKQLLELGQYSEAMAKYVALMINSRVFEMARQGMQETADGRVLSMTGWLPARRQKDVASFLDKYTAWYRIEGAAPGDEVPVKLRNGAYSRMFETITNIYSLPVYFEVDPTPFFAPFFMMFVGLCLGDLGYGLIVTALGAIMAVRAKPGKRGLFVMVTMLGISTAVAGILLNSFFGCVIFGGPGIAPGTSLFPSGADIFSPLGQVEGAQGPVFPMMSFALVIGVIQVLLGMALRAVNQFRDGGWQGCLMPISTMLILAGLIVWGAQVNFLDLGMNSLVIGPLKIGAFLTALPRLSGPSMLWGGVVLLLLFNNPSLKLFWRPLMGLWEIYQLAGGLISNLLSYLRLFALGLSGGLLGAAFNQIAFMFILKDGKPEWATPMAVFTVLLLVVGHSINIGLSAIGSFVHPLRLTFVEFYSNVGFKGGGRIYTPLSRPADNS
jgi:V/A-type H+-transporting ATPase subunit I